MKLDETTTLLAAIAAADRHGPRPSRSTARVWADLLDSVPLEAALRVVREHYQRTAETITPDQLRAGWREHAQRAHRGQRQIHRRPRADPAVARRGMTAVYAATGWTRPPRQAMALSVPCPVEVCATPAKVICAPVNLPEQRDRDLRVHPSRIDAGRANDEAAEVSA